MKLKKAAVMKKIYVKNNPLLKNIIKHINSSSKTQGMRCLFEVDEYDVTQVTDAVTYLKRLGYNVNHDNSYGSRHTLTIDWKDILENEVVSGDILTVSLKEGRISNKKEFKVDSEMTLKRFIEYCKEEYDYSIDRSDCYMNIKSIKGE